MSWNKDNLRKAFDKAGLVLDFAKQSFASGRSAGDIFGLDIRRKQAGKPHTEYFLMWPGHDSNSIAIRDTNKELGQLVLTISEESREFEETLPEWEVTSAKRRGVDPVKQILDQARAGYPKVKTYQPKKNLLIVIRKTPKNARSFLVGRDERQLFMTQVNSNITTVKAAHDSLKTPIVTFFEGKADGKTIRQGEWFFVNLPSNELKNLELAIKKNLVSPVKKVPIGNFAGRRGGKPHTADELLVSNLDFSAIPVKPEYEKFNAIEEYTVHPSVIRAHGANELGLAEMLRNNSITKKEVIKWDPDNAILIVRLPKSGRRMIKSPVMAKRNEVYVRGAVRHLDHETVKFSNWRKVIANTETMNNAANMGAAVGGGTWID